MPRSRRETSVRNTTPQPLTHGLRRAFEDEGLKLHLTPAEADDYYRRVVGDERFASFCETMDAVRAGHATLHDALLQPKSIREALALMSAQGTVTVAVNTAVLDRSGILELSNGSVAELGCYAGTVARYASKKCPRLAITGFDRLPGLMTAARSASTGNAAFEVWDYSDGSRAVIERFHSLWGAFPIDFVIPPHADSEMATEAYFEQSLLPLKHWRMIALENATLTIALRLSDVHAYWGVVQAAIRAGWNADPELEKVDVAGEVFPILRLRTGEPRHATAEDSTNAISQWDSAPLTDMRIK